MTTVAMPPREDGLAGLTLNHKHTPGLVDEIMDKSTGQRFRWVSDYGPLALRAEIYDDEDGGCEMSISSDLTGTLTTFEAITLANTIGNRDLPQWLDDCATVLAALNGELDEEDEDITARDAVSEEPLACSAGFSWCEPDRCGDGFHAKRIVVKSDDGTETLYALGSISDPEDPSSEPAIYFEIDEWNIPLSRVDLEVAQIHSLADNLKVALLAFAHLVESERQEVAS